MRCAKGIFAKGIMGCTGFSMAVNGGHVGTKKGPNWGHVTKDFF